jgi:F0F1-type ATP synthase assembly protein I
MPLDKDQNESKRGSNTFNLALAAIAGQVGCITLVIVIIALFGGLWLDNYFNSRPIFTIGLMVASIPVTLVLMFWIVKKATTRLNQDQKSMSSNSAEDR